jgi:hypothetical protein
MQRRVTRSGREEEEDLVRGRKERGNAEEGDEKWKRRRGRFREMKECRGG